MSSFSFVKRSPGLPELTIPGIHALEIIAVDDGSTDGSPEILDELAASHDRLQVIRHDKNRGKGAAIQSGIAKAAGDLIVINDADLEYDPKDLELLVRPFLEDGADVVYGSRFLSRERRRVLYFRHAMGNRFITFLSNLATDLNLTDVETCYKMFRAELLKSIPIRSNDFRFEVEITAKVAKRRFHIFEVPISYLGRSYQEGKKIGWKDGVKALSFNSQILEVRRHLSSGRIRISHPREPRERPIDSIDGWPRRSIPWVGSTVLEIGAGIGNITSELIPRDRYVASDINPHYLQYLENFTLGKPYLSVKKIDLEHPSDFAGLEGSFDTVICLNVLEHVADPVTSLRNLYSALKPGGRLVLYVPQDQRLFSSLDVALEHCRRYDRTTARKTHYGSRVLSRDDARFQSIRAPGLVVQRKNSPKKTPQPFSAQGLQFPDSLSVAHRSILTLEGSRVDCTIEKRNDRVNIDRNG